MLVKHRFVLNSQLFVISHRPLWFALAWGSSILGSWSLIQIDVHVMAGLMKKFYPMPDYCRAVDSLSKSSKYDSVLGK